MTTIFSFHNQITNDYFQILKGASTMDLKDVEVKEKSLVFYLRRVRTSSQPLSSKISSYEFLRISHFSFLCIFIQE